MTKYCIYSKRPLQFQIKSGYNHKGIKFRGVAPQFFVFFHIGVPLLPLVIRHVGIFANIPTSACP